MQALILRLRRWLCWHDWRSMSNYSVRVRPSLDEGRSQWITCIKCWKRL